SAWACVPYVLFLLAAGMAIGGRGEVFARDYQLLPADIPGVLAAVLLLMVATCWYLVAFVNVSAVAAGTGRRRALGALVLAFLFLAGLSIVLALVAAVAYFSNGGTL